MYSRLCSNNFEISLIDTPIQGIILVLFSVDIMVCHSRKVGIQDVLESFVDKSEGPNIGGHPPPPILSKEKWKIVVDFFRLSPALWYHSHIVFQLELEGPLVPLLVDVYIVSKFFLSQTQSL